MHRPKKSLGQNFLKSQEALRDIITAGDIKADDVILEIGPGKGALTDLLLQHAGKVIAIEKDRELIALLSEQYKQEIEEKKLVLLEDDALEFDIFFIKGNYKLIANIPYYITGALIQKFLTALHQPEHMVLLVQKEVAQRIVARDKKESILSMSVKAYGTPKYIGTVKAKYFSPAPKVDSAVILVEKISRDFFQDISEALFFEIMKKGFAHKRKMLIGNLKEYAQITNKSLEEIFDSLHINKKARAEDLTLEQWKQLCLKLQ
jgi:16S rRNA (adenine1518-N6/adenine1519-N6)-dimethyltransferase